MAEPVIRPDSFSPLDVLSLVSWRYGKHRIAMSIIPTAAVV